MIIPAHLQASLEIVKNLLENLHKSSRTLTSRRKLWALRSADLSQNFPKHQLSNFVIWKRLELEEKKFSIPPLIADTHALWIFHEALFAPFGSFFFDPKR